MRRVQPDENRCTATVPSAKGRRCFKPKRFGNLCVKHAHADELHRERAARLAAEQERDRHVKLIEDLTKTLEGEQTDRDHWQRGYKYLSDRVATVEADRDAAVATRDDWKRLAETLSAQRDAANEALAVAENALLEISTGPNPEALTTLDCLRLLGRIIETARAAVAKIDAAQRDSGVGATMSHCGKSPTDAAARGRKG